MNDTDSEEDLESTPVIKNGAEVEGNGGVQQGAVPTAPLMGTRKEIKKDKKARGKYREKIAEILGENSWKFRKQIAEILGNK